jgi:SET and MYND domain-containing protein
MILKYARIDELSTHNIDIMSIDYKSRTSAGDYEQVFNLLTHERKTHIEDLFKYGLTAILLGKHYSKVSQDSGTQDMLKPASCLILRHLMQTICNAHAITRLRDSDTESASQNTMSREQIRYATAIYPRVSLLNHSCNPNVLSSFRANTSIIVVKASRGIDEREEIFNCYGPHFSKMLVSERQQSLSGQYHFKCECDMCVKQLASLKVETQRCGVKCLFCQSKDVTMLKGTALKCEECSGSLDFRDYWRIFEVLRIEFDKISASRMAKKSSEQQAGVDELLSLISEYREHLLIGPEHEIEKSVVVHENFKMIYMAYSKLVDCLARAYSDLGQFERSGEVVEKNIKLLAHLYGLDSATFVSKGKETSEASVEIAHELFKLAEIQCNCNSFKKAMVNLNKAIAIAEVFYSKDNRILQDFYGLKKNILSVL